MDATKQIRGIVSYSVMQSDGNSFCKKIVMESFKKDILDQIYVYVCNFIIMI